jgi:hypothetical protein
MSSIQQSLPGQSARRLLVRVFSPRAMETVFDPFLADLQADWLRAKSNQSAHYTRRSLFSAYVSLVVQVATFAIGSFLALPMSSHPLRIPMRCVPTVGYPLLGRPDTPRR